jgi:CRP-like cAMP-binding protein
MVVPCQLTATFCWIFAGVPEVLLLELCSNLQRHVVPPGMTLAVAGEGADCLWLLRHGSVMAIQPEALVSQP